MNRFSIWTAPVALSLIASLAVGPEASAQDSGFMDDYSIFDFAQPHADVEDILEGSIYLDQLYLIPQWRERAKMINAVMVDQPEVWIDPESPYKGAKPDALKILADNLRQGFTEHLSTDFEIAEEPGPGVLYIHWAITDLYLAKKKKKFYQYTPTGFVLSSAKNALIQDIWKKVDIVEMTLELELIDTGTQELRAAGIAQEGARKDKKAGQKKRDPVTWEEIDGLTQTMTARMACRIKNSRRAEAERVNCPAITFVAEK